MSLHLAYLLIAAFTLLNLAIGVGCWRYASQESYLKGFEHGWRWGSQDKAPGK